MRGNHRGFINDKKRVTVLVFAAHEPMDAVFIGDAVNPFVDGVGFAAGVLRKHLRSATRGREHHNMHPDVVERFHEGTHQAGLAGAGVTCELKQEVFTFPVNEVGDSLHGLRLTCRRLKSEMPMQVFLKCTSASIHFVFDGK